MPDLLSYHFDTAEVRVVIRDGKPWWAAFDVCAILGLKNVTRAISRLRQKEKMLVQGFELSVQPLLEVKVTNVHDDEKDVHSMNTLGRSQDMWVVNNTGLYRLIFRSRKPEAERFQDWVYEDVLPSIQQHGFYTTVNTLHDQILALHMANKTQQEAFALERKILDEKRIFHSQEATYWQMMCLEGSPYRPAQPKKKPRHR